jgi:hypothetical protein
MPVDKKAPPKPKKKPLRASPKKKPLSLRKEWDLILGPRDLSLRELRQEENRLRAAKKKKGKK